MIAPPIHGTATSIISGDFGVNCFRVRIFDCSYFPFVKEILQNHGICFEKAIEIGEHSYILDVPDGLQKKLELDLEGFASLQKYHELEASVSLIEGERMRILLSGIPSPFFSNHANFALQVVL